MTGVQTCALPIFPLAGDSHSTRRYPARRVGLLDIAGSFGSVVGPTLGCAR